MRSYSLGNFHRVREIVRIKRVFKLWKVKLHRVSGKKYLFNWFVSRNLTKNPIEGSTFFGHPVESLL